MENIFQTANILLPNEKVDMRFWPCLACDQFTSESEYWQKVKDICEGNESTFHITLPEIYLEDDDIEQKIGKIQSNMQNYLQDILTKSVNGFIYTKRTFTDAKGELCGIVGAVDLQAYSYEKNSLPKIRPSEGTVVERIPPRLAVRKNANLETPHILMLIDDEKREIIENLETYATDDNLLYSTDLMLKGGTVKGYAVTDENVIRKLQNEISALGTQSNFDAKYPEAKGCAPLTMAVGDGNHSLATAKAHWENVRQNLSESEQETHPARFCLVELVNIHSPAIEIEPIHRVVFDIDANVFKTAFENWLIEKGAVLGTGKSENEQVIKIVGKGDGNITKLRVQNAPHPLAVGTVEDFLDVFTKKHSAKVDYIHGEESVLNLAQQNSTGIILPEFKKSDLFKGVVLGGALPRKTFSMGTAIQKRYYLECRKIVL